MRSRWNVSACAAAAAMLLFTAMPGDVSAFRAPDEPQAGSYVRQVQSLSLRSVAQGSLNQAISGNAVQASRNLVEQISPCISRSVSPIWEDRSTGKEAEYLTEALKDEGGILNITGNRAELRFPASQILKWAKENPEEYENTSNIFVLSAFITSVLSGKISAVDTGDGWGANLNNLDIDNPGWSDKIRRAASGFVYLRKWFGHKRVSN